MLLISVKPGDPAALCGEITGRPLPSTPGSTDEDFNQIAIWLQSCLNSHVACVKPSSDTPLPTRIIDVGSSGSSDEPRLIESCGRRGLYIALSHCWGGKVALTTTVATLSERMQSIPLESMPKTFREAVLVTRKLGVRYLWIDSLCILQDSREDWEKESAVMGDIYSSNVLTIGARGSSNSLGGLFITREREPTPCRLQYKGEDGLLSGSMFIRSPAFQHERLRDSPLDTRGWVLQERILSPRLLYFGRQQLHWECAESTFRQDGRAPDVPLDGLRSGKHFKQNMDFNVPAEQNHDHFSIQGYDSLERAKFRRAARLLQWYTLVEEYTICHLTYPSDKLPALSGMAKAFQNKTGYKYLAGVWEEDVIAGIAWRLRKPALEPISRTLPSWTWARFDGGVGFWCVGNSLPLREPDGCCKLIQTLCTSAGGHNPHGDIANAELQVQGQLIEVTYRPLPLQVHLRKNNITVFAMDDMGVGNVIFDLQASYSPPFRSFFCLLLHGGKYDPVGLALQPAPTACATSFVRIGLVNVYSMGVEEDPRGLAAFRDVGARVISIL